MQGETLNEKVDFPLPEYFPTKGYIETPYYVIGGIDEIFKYANFLKISKKNDYKVHQIIYLRDKVVIEYKKL